MGKVTLRLGHEVWNFTSPNDAARYKAALAEGLPRPLQADRASNNFLDMSEKDPEAPARVLESANGDVLGVAERTSNKCLSLLVAKLALTGPATCNFATALPPAPIRQLLQSRLSRDTPLLQVLQWIAAASDAGRHLVPSIMAEAITMVGEATQGLGKTAVMEVRSLLQTILPPRQLLTFPPPM